MMKVVFIGLGGFVGAVGRYGLSHLVHRHAGHAFPYGTLAVNVAGCFALGGLLFLSEDKAVLTPAVRTVIAMGVLGAFTTFSTFGHETVELMLSGRAVHAAANVALNVTLGLAAVWLARWALKASGI